FKRRKGGADENPRQPGNGFGANGPPFGAESPGHLAFGHASPAAPGRKAGTFDLHGSGEVTYYRGLRTPASERETRFRSAGQSRRDRQGSQGGKSLFLKLFASKEAPEAAREKKVYSYYRPGVTPVDDTPGFSA